MITACTCGNLCTASTAAFLIVRIVEYENNWGPAADWWIVSSLPTCITFIHAFIRVFTICPFYVFSTSSTFFLFSLFSLS